MYKAVLTQSRLKSRKSLYFARSYYLSETHEKMMSSDNSKTETWYCNFTTFTDQLLSLSQNRETKETKVSIILFCMPCWVRVLQAISFIFTTAFFQSQNRNLRANIIFCCTGLRFCSLPLLPLSLSFSHTYIHTYTHTQSLSLTHSYTFSLCISLSHTHTHTHTHTRTHTYIHRHTYTYTHTHTFNLTRTRSKTNSHVWNDRDDECRRECKKDRDRETIKQTRSIHFLRMWRVMTYQSSNDVKCHVSFHSTHLIFFILTQKFSAIVIFFLCWN